jgi:RES domain
LSAPPLSSNRDEWMQPSDYSRTQGLAAQARLADIELIRYESVRNVGGICLAILSPDMFGGIDAYRNNQQTWNLHIEPPAKVTWQRELSGDGFSFDFPSCGMLNQLCD